jgi:hypothetical protein
LPLDLVQDGTALLAQHFLKDAATSIDCCKGVTFPLKRLVADNEEFSDGSLSVQSPFEMLRSPRAPFNEVALAEDLTVSSDKSNILTQAGGVVVPVWGTLGLEVGDNSCGRSPRPSGV